MAQVKDVLKESKDVKGDEIDSLMNIYRGLFQSDLIEDNEFKVIIDLGNTFIKKRLLDYPEWYYLIKNLAYLEQNEEEKMALPWLKGLSELADKNPSKSTFNFLQTSYIVFYDNVLYDDGRIRWQVEGGYFDYSYE